MPKTYIAPTVTEQTLWTFFGNLAGFTDDALIEIEDAARSAILQLKPTQYAKRAMFAKFIDAILDERNDRTAKALAI